MGPYLQHCAASGAAQAIVYGGSERQRRTTADVVPLKQFAEFLADPDRPLRISGPDISDR